MNLRFLQLMLWAHGREMRARLRSVRRQSRLSLFVLGGFALGYLLVGFFLFRSGLRFLHSFPVVGLLLSQRILYLLFAFFFIMLVFSNAIIGYTAAFKNRETAWLLTLPIRHEDIYRWKFLETIAVSSWALLFLGAPMMAAYGNVSGAQPLFYVAVLLGFGPFVVLPAVVASALVLLLVRTLGHPLARKTLMLVAIAALVGAFLFFKAPHQPKIGALREIVTFDQLLSHTRASLHPLLPSAWMAQCVLAWSEPGLFRQGAFSFLVLLSNALFGALVTSQIVARFFYGTWTLLASSRASRQEARSARRQGQKSRRSWLARVLAAVPWLSRPAKAMLLKDILVFVRDPSQWSQFAIFFGLLCLYILNLRTIAYDVEGAYWTTLISYLNLGACSLTLSTLTTRFVFPQFSLEGRRLWIIGLAPLGLRKVLLLKFWASAAAAMTITTSLMITSSFVLRLPLGQMALFAVAIASMSVALSGIAVGLGALFPNLKEDNPTKIVSGFGGTLCLVISFIYLTLMLALLALPATLPFTQRRLSAVAPAITTGCFTLALLLTLVVVIVPMFLGIRRVKNLEI